MKMVIEVNEEQERTLNLLGKEKGISDINITGQLLFDNTVEIAAKDGWYYFTTRNKAFIMAEVFDEIEKKKKCCPNGTFKKIEKGVKRLCQC